MALIARQRCPYWKWFRSLGVLCYSMAFLSCVGVIDRSAGQVAAPIGRPCPFAPEPERSSDRVVDGTALCTLIQQNQDYDVWLCPEEKEGDDTDIPRWLRVYWRKSHTAAGCPQHLAHYPHVLLDLYEWMLRHQNFEIESVAPDVHFDIGDKPGSIAANNTNPRSESDIQMSPFTPTYVVAAANSNSAQAQSYSGDGGHTWTESALPLQSIQASVQDDLHADPAVKWIQGGGCGTATAMTVGLRHQPPNHSLRSFISQDCGATWTYDATPSWTHTAVDKPAMWTDLAANKLYAVYKNYDVNKNADPVFLVARNGSGWSTPVQVSPDESTQGLDVFTDSASHLYVFWRSISPSLSANKIRFATSVAGTTFTQHTPIAPVFGAEFLKVPAAASRGGLVYVSAGVFGNYLYASWTDLNGNSDCDEPYEHPKNVGSPCTSRVRFARSPDGGSSWIVGILYDRSGPPYSDQFNQRLAVDSQTGILAIIYYDTFCDVQRKRTCLSFQVSRDNGMNWTPPETISSAPTDESVGSASGEQYGDYNGLSMFDGLAIASWTDRSRGGKEEIWSVRRCVDPSPPANVTATAIGRQVILTWTAAARATDYRVRRTTTPGGPYMDVGQPTTQTTITDTVSAPGTVYYVVSSRRSCESPNSAEVMVSVIQ